MCRVTHVLVVAIIGLPLLLVIWMQAGSLSKITDEDIVAPPPKAIAARRAEHSAAALPSANASMTNRPPLRILCLGDLLTGGYTRGGLPRFNHPYGIRLEQQIRAFLDSNGTGAGIFEHACRAVAFSPSLILS